MAVGRHRAPANIRSELVVIGALFTTDSHHRLPLRIFFFLLLLFISLSWKKKIVLIEIFFLQLHPPKTRSKLNFVKILNKRG
jgi:hypothetical protein